MRVGIDAHLLAFTENYRQAGLSRYIDELLRQMPSISRRDHFVAFVGNGAIPQSYLTARSPNLTFSRSHFPTVKAPVRIAWEQLILPFASLQKRLDLLHCPVNVRPVASVYPVVVTIHDLIFLRYPGSFHPAKRRYLTAMTGWSARHAAQVITVSEATRRDVISLLKVPPDKVTAVANGVSAQFRPLPQHELAEFKGEKEISGKIILYVGTLEPRKRITTLLRAFREVADNPLFDDTTLVIGGSKGWYYDEIFSTAKELGLTESGRVRFLGRVPDEELALWYNIATLFAYPSLYEGFGLPALEAMACGTPVVASNRSSLPEVVGGSGLLLEPEAIEEWSQAIKMLLSDSARRAELAKRALQRAQSFSWERTARETIEVYKRALEAQCHEA
ncbi:MAG: glycosyltransferase family 4 protein [Chloroflexi bacterium]|nr:glycosyltransferase family 4 protein [Chloroflexota bacterium]